MWGLVALTLHLSGLAVTDACRWALYAGKETIPAKQLLLEDVHALIPQATKPPLLPELSDEKYYKPGQVSQRNHAVNVDGWGVGWYDEEGHTHRNRSGSSAMTDEEVDPDLLALASTVHSHTLFAHIRAASAGDVNNINSHPFQFNQMLWMHNGGIYNKEALLDHITCSKAKRLISGQTDSEYAGALFASALVGDICSRSSFTLSELQTAMRTLVERIQDAYDTHDHESGAYDPAMGSSMNFAVTDGARVVVTRYRTCEDEEPPSLYYAMGNDSLYVASEPLDGTMYSEDTGREWHLLAKDQMLSYDVATNNLSFSCLSKSCTRALRQHCYKDDDDVEQCEELEEEL